jgi:hypothetical protein
LKLMNIFHFTTTICRTLPTTYLGQCYHGSRLLKPEEEIIST